ncbi:MAG: hypothetical protein JWP89_5331 [Schlesneria sp.]|nr:hypothetical protein [Schlesneria sp.]
MAIAIEGFTVVGSKSRIQEDFEGGLAALSQMTPNATELTDDHLWRCSFMAAVDAQMFLGQLQQVGMNTTQGPDSVFVLVSEFDLSVEPYCEWLSIAQWEKGVIAWREGTTPDKVIAREGWSPERGSGLLFKDATDPDNLTFLRTEGNVDVYFDKQGQRELYSSRTNPDPDAVFKAAAGVIQQYLSAIGSRLPSEKIAEVRRAISDLEGIESQASEAWQIPFFIGKGQQILGEIDFAHASFRKAYALDQDTEVILRELAGMCLELGKSEEAVRIGEKAAALAPDSATTLGNLACAYLIAARIPAAMTTVKAAILLDQKDEINQRLLRIITDVASGKRSQPRCMSDLNNPARTSLWIRLQFWKRSD